MRIIDFDKAILSEGAQVRARIVWEEVDRRDQTVFIQTDERFSSDLRPTANSFLLASAVPAMQAGERRISVEGAVCPELKNGLDAALTVLANWSPLSQSVPTVEAKNGFCAVYPRQHRRSACFTSGGVDSFAMLQANREQLPLNHPNSFRDALFVQGLDIAPAEPRRCSLYDKSLAAIESIAGEANIQVVPIITNVRALEPDGTTWPTQGFGMVTIAIAHALSSRMDRISLAASLHVGSLAPCASHPMIDPFSSASNLQVIHADSHRTRLQKVAALANWPAAIRNLRVCWSLDKDADSLNCGRCRKCVMTLMQLLASNALEHAHSFPCREVTPEMAQVIDIDNAMLLGFYDELSTALTRCKRTDLVKVIREKMEKFQERQQELNSSMK